ncbi:hypothetical protein NRS6084_02304 [Bacillus subtilis]|uniref:hypothetical protein n=1 Tax=Bacillus subtilis TaxID=1423 RepID=UPI000956D881|nr:hypothetical protein [Bacillus subtilis]CAF1747968.1 hypothetical protein NRS6084_02304 [Bacillus subtilis]SIQ35906.1 hypothetical protein SAMN05878487_1116 [Bacillus subtilis]
MTVLKKILFYLWCVIRKTVIFVFIPTQNFSHLLIQSIILVPSVGVSLGMILRSGKIIEITGFLLSNILMLSLLYWVLTFLSHLSGRNDLIYVKTSEQKPFSHEISKINDIIAVMEEIKKSLKEWAGIDRDQALERLKLLRIYNKVSSGKKNLNFFSNSIIAAIFGLTTSIIFNKDIMNCIKKINGDKLKLVDENLIYYASGTTLFLFGLIISAHILIHSHRMNKQSELYEEILNKLILELEEKPVETENNTPST